MNYFFNTEKKNHRPEGDTSNDVTLLPVPVAGGAGRGGREGHDHHLGAVPGAASTSTLGRGLLGQEDEEVQDVSQPLQHGCGESQQPRDAPSFS